MISHLSPTSLRMSPTCLPVHSGCSKCFGPLPSRLSLPPACPPLVSRYVLDSLPCPPLVSTCFPPVHTGCCKCPGSHDPTTCIDLSPFVDQSAGLHDFTLVSHLSPPLSLGFFPLHSGFFAHMILHLSPLVPLLSLVSHCIRFVFQLSPLVSQLSLVAHYTAHVTLVLSPSTIWML